MKKLENVAMKEEHPHYTIGIQRKEELYTRRKDLRTPFGRDYTRIIFSQAYRRLKNKTQVFFAIDDDHVCTRNEHVNLVESVSYTIANELGLNVELTKAIAVGHDLGHAPFGHGGESIITKIAKEHGIEKFWHERNSLHFVDDIEVLEDNDHHFHNLNLTYAVRDGIISHCGEMNQRFIMPRSEAIDLADYTYAGEYNPYTYEGCVVKMSDKIAYLARDIEDALRLDIITEEQVNELKKRLNKIGNYTFNAINNGSVVNYFIHDVIDHSNEEVGIGLSEEALEIMKEIMKFNYENIYLIKRVKVHNNYVSLILHSIFDCLYEYKNQPNLLESLKKDEKLYPKLISHYISWIEKYAKIPNTQRLEICDNHIVYDFTKPGDFERSILDYLSGMSDQFILQSFNELISF